MMKAMKTTPCGEPPAVHPWIFDGIAGERREEPGISWAASAG
ncbi:MULTISPECIES: hypothetical protein [unclassified Streptomyces]